MELMEKTLVMSFLVPRTMLLRNILTVLCGQKDWRKAKAETGEVWISCRKPLLPHGDSSWEEVALRGAVVSVFEIFKT